MINKLLGYLLLSYVFLVVPSVAQPGVHYMDLHSRILNVVFPLEVEPKPYFRKMVLRFSDSNTQLTIVTYFGGKSEIIRYKFADLNDDEYYQLVRKMKIENPNVSEQEIAAKIKVDATRLTVKPEMLEQAISELEAIRISPILGHRISLGGSVYEFWYDTWQESVHYVINGPSNDFPQDDLVQWMIRFQASVPSLLKPSSATNEPSTK